MTLTKFDWTQYNLVRIARIAGGSNSCAPLLDALPKEQIDPALKAFRDKIENGLSSDNQLIFELSQSLESYPEKTLGFELYRHYQRYGFSLAGSPDSIFPSRYIFLHDAHHVLIGSGTDYQGEMEVVAFEGSLCGKTSEALMPILTQLWGFSECKKFTPDFIRICTAWGIGADTTGDLIETWNIESDLSVNLEELRSHYNIKPLG